MGDYSNTLAVAAIWDTGKNTVRYVWGKKFKIYLKVRKLGGANTRRAAGAVQNVTYPTTVVCDSTLQPTTWYLPSVSLGIMNAIAGAGINFPIMKIYYRAKNPLNQNVKRLAS